MSVAVIWRVSERRRDKRFAFTEPTNGALRVFPDVVVQKDGDGVWTGISWLPVGTGETFVLDVVEIDETAGEVHRRVPVCVIESRPVLVEGELCHRLRLHTNMLSSVEFEQHVRRG